MEAVVPPGGGPPLHIQYIAEVSARYAEAAPRYVMEFFVDGPRS